MIYFICRFFIFVGMKNIPIIEQAIKALGIESLTPMQEDTVNHATDKRDVILLSPTGSGKTLAYLLPLLVMLAERGKREGSYALVLAPSRELAVQVNRVFTSLKSGFGSVCCYGGHSMVEEKKSLQANDAAVIIGTPGRILDHIERGNLNTSSIELLTIDEFDKALELGFHEEMSKIIDLLPILNRRFLLSATDAKEIPQFTGVGRVLKLDYLDEKEELEERLDQVIVNSPQKDKLDTLYQLLCTFGGASTIVFCNHREAVDRINSYLVEQKVESEGFHGGMEQDHRERSLYKFSNGTANVLVSTDLASRGLDIPEVQKVVHYHLPVNEEAFTHRNGRTARWQSTGASYIILHGEESVPVYVSGNISTFEFPDYIPAPTRSEWATIYIGKGKKDKVNKIDIVGLFCKKGKLKGEDLGRIDVKDHFAYIAVRRKHVKQLLKLLQGEKIKGSKTIFQEAY